MRDALEASGVDVEYMLLKGVGHSFGGVDTRMLFYSKLETFLTEYLGE